MNPIDPLLKLAGCDTPLRAYLARHGLSIFTFARQINLDYSGVKRLCEGRGLPSLPLAAYLEAQTQGGVKMKDWLATDIGRQAYALVGTDWERLEVQRKQEHERNDKSRYRMKRTPQEDHES